ncbi:type VI secretion system baseplate subunit TssF [Aquimarina aquimarini]|uniref:type VI secretion system baseplate subunit TssF n=1 Tax=Aquimarina aquimarini TaxID=1191734 RepID=UPI000D554368|nr:type VI secretion system baseplate subunit TssF [Aquimarina aquimarini]
MSQENKTQIKNRMIKKAASLWGVQPNEIETSFDPVITLLISACASEIAKISGEINNSQSRVTEQLIQLMTPETLYGARPAHAIAYVEPISPESTISPENLFYFNKKIKSSKAEQKTKNIFFSPAQESKLIDAQITHMLCGDEGYEVEGKLRTNITLSKKDKGALPSSTVYLGIKSENDTINLKDVSLFFEILDIQDRELFYHHLRQAKFYYNDSPINVSTGYMNSDNSKRLDLESIFAHTPNKTRNIENDVKKIYEKHYITLKSNISLQRDGKIPKEIIKFIDYEDTEDFQDINWIKIVFPKVISNTILQSLFCSFNAFPVLNRKLESVSFQLKDYINIAPLSTMDLFLDIKSVSNTSGETYSLRADDAEKDQKGTFVIRRDNVGKLDSRKAKEYLLHLIELLKDESAAFSVYGNDFLQSNVNKLNQNIATLEKKVLDMTKTIAETNYVSVKPYRKKDTLLIEYWTTNGQEANQIKSGKTLNIYKGSELKQKSGVFLTPTFQGKDNLTMEERLFAYRRALLSRNRIITKEDVKALCYEICSNKIKEVTIKKGFKTNTGLNKGLVPSIEITLHPNSSVKTSDLEWDSIKINILSILEKQSLNLFPYYITVLN